MFSLLYLHSRAGSRAQTVENKKATRLGGSLKMIVLDGYL
jgi:hypothetical protein